MKKVFVFVLFLFTVFLAGCNTIDGITITSENGQRTLNVGSTLQLKATVFPEGVSQEVLWSSESNEIATVDENGLVTAVSLGNVNIVATSKEDDSVSQSFALIISTGEEVAITSLEIVTPESTKLTSGESLTLSLNISPSGATEDVEWTSSDPSIASVSKGVVTGIKEGSVTITCKAKGNDEIKDEITLTIEKGNSEDNSEFGQMDYSTHEEYISSEAETKLKVKGVVVYIYPNDGQKANYVIQNGTDGYYVYAQDITKYPVEVGKVYEVGGYKKNYNGLCELVNVEYFKELDENITYTPNKLENVDTSSLEAMDPYQGSIVYGKAVIKSVSVNQNKAYSFYATLGEYELQFRVDAAYCTSEDLIKINTMLSNTVVGTEFDFSGVMTAFGYGKAKPQIQVIKASDLGLGEVSAEDLLAAAMDKVVVSSSISYSVDTIELPKSISGFDATISWNSNNEAINVETGKVTHGEENITVTLTCKLTMNGLEVTKDFNVVIFALDNSEYEVLATLDLEDALPANSWGNSDSKLKYEAAVVELGTPKHNWLLKNALIAATSGDIYDGKFAIRAIAGKSASETARIEIQEDGEYNVVEFATAVYGSDASGIKIKVEYSLDSGASWLASEEVVTVSSKTLETFRIKLPSGVKRIALVVVENSGNRVNIDNIKLMK